MLPWYLLILIPIVWIVAVFVINMIVLPLLRHKKPKRESLSEFFGRLMWEFIPPAIFLFYHLMMFFWRYFKPAFYPIMGVLIVRFVIIPILRDNGWLISDRIRYSPKKIKKYIASLNKSFANYKNDYLRIHIPGNYPDSEIAAAYISDRLDRMRGRIGSTYYRFSTRRKKDLIDAVIEESVKSVPNFDCAEYQDVLATAYDISENIILYFKDGSRSEVDPLLPIKKEKKSNLSESDKKRLSDSKRLQHITYTGRLFYLFMCTETYLVTKYPDKEWTLVAGRLWNRTISPEGWNFGAPGDYFREIMPRDLFVYGSYEEVNVSRFDRNLSEDVYNECKALYADMDKEERRAVSAMLDIVWNTMYNCKLQEFGNDFGNRYTLKYIKEAEDYLTANDVPLPDLSKVEEYSFDGSKVHGKDKRTPQVWGFGVDGRKHSIILCLKKTEKCMDYIEI